MSLSSSSNSIINSISATNPVINGEMLVDQANVGAAVTVAITTPTYIIDCWYGFTAGATVQGQQVAGSGEFSKALQVTGAASVTAITLGTRIEALNSGSLANKLLQCRVNIKNSLLTSVTWTAYYPTVSNTFSTKTQISTGTLTVTSTATDYYFSFNAGANVTNGLCIEFSVGAQTSGTFVVTGVDIATQTRDYPHLPIQDNITYSQRYYQEMLVDTLTYNLAGSSYLAPYWHCTMFATPTGVVKTQGLYSNTTSVTLTPGSASSGRLAYAATSIGYSGGATVITLSARL